MNMDENGLAIALAAALAVGAGVVAGRTRFGGRLRGSFGQGFVGFRPDGWARGVQEDDDARWSWPGSGSGEDAGRRPFGCARAVPPQRPQR
jgi:hypothetical protein